MMRFGPMLRVVKADEMGIWLERMPAIYASLQLSPPEQE